MGKTIFLDKRILTLNDAQQRDMCAIMNFSFMPDYSGINCTFTGRFQERLNTEAAGSAPSDSASSVDKHQSLFSQQIELAIEWADDDSDNTNDSCPYITLDNLGIEIAEPVCYLQRMVKPDVLEIFLCTVTEEIENEFYGFMMNYRSIHMDVLAMYFLYGMSISQISEIDNDFDVQKILADFGEDIRCILNMNPSPTGIRYLMYHATTFNAFDLLLEKPYHELAFYKPTKKMTLVEYLLLLEKRTIARQENKFFIPGKAATKQDIKKMYKLIFCYSMTTTLPKLILSLREKTRDYDYINYIAEDLCRKLRVPQIGIDDLQLCVDGYGGPLIELLIKDYKKQFIGGYHKRID